VFVALVMQHAKRMRRIVICGPSGSTLFFHIISQTAQFSYKSFCKMCVLIFSTRFVWNICHSEKKSADIVISVDGSSCKLPVILVRFKWNLNFVDIFSKHSNIEFHEKPFGGSRVYICGWTHRQTDMTKPMVAFRNFAKAPKNCSIHQISSLYINLLFG